MNKILKLNNKEYEVINDYKEALNEEELQDKFTDYFEEFDYVVGDYAYSKLRLKGFYDSKNSKVSKINDIKNLDNYIKNNCAYGCKWFELKKVDKK